MSKTQPARGVVEGPRSHFGRFRWEVVAMNSRKLIFVILFVATGPLPGAEPVTEQLPGAKMIDAYFRRRVKQIGDDCLKDVRSRADWEQKRPELRRQFLDMLGLWPLPPRTDLK